MIHVLDVVSCTHTCRKANANATRPKAEVAAGSTLAPISPPPASPTIAEAAKARLGKAQHAAKRPPIAMPLPLMLSLPVRRPSLSCVSSGGASLVRACAARPRRVLRDGTTTLDGVVWGGDRRLAGRPHRCLALLVAVTREEHVARLVRMRMKA